MVQSSSEKTTDLSHLVTTVLRQVKMDVLRELAHEGYSPTTKLNPSLEDTMTHLVWVIASQSTQKRTQSFSRDAKPRKGQPSTLRVNRVTGVANSLRQRVSFASSTDA